MSKALIGKWGKNLAVRFPAEIAEAARLKNGEEVEFDTRDGDIVIRRPNAHARANAKAAAKEIMTERRKYSLGKITIRELIGRDSH
jgi:antitoxin MazE